MFKTKMKDCQVCAKGALFMVKAANFNNVKNTDIYIDCDDHTCMTGLSDCFDREMLDGIEQDFERWNNARGKYLSDLSYEDRLRCICQNIIDHKGNYKRNVEYVVE